MQYRGKQIDIEMNQWNPEQYLQFKSERTQPAIDLVSRIIITEPQSIIDIGCGPGNSTQILVNRWPDSEIVGLDKLTTMIEKARQDYPKQKWIVDNAKNIINYNLMGRFYFHLIDYSLLDISNNLQIILS